ncbi:hypothetical protein K474DRAFT_1667904 [Panus rudis PR-1116 ss-1]|nr:hypothetical protein K474DRAFT_1667904 [Panus rudis PR-1116 ss-1]
MPELPPEKLPSDVPIVDHCWCDVATGDFFEPFNISRWEHESVKRLKTDLETKLKPKENIMSVANEKTVPTAAIPPHSPEPASDSTQNNSPEKALNFALPWPFSGASRTPSPLPPTPIRSETKETDTTYATSTSPNEAAYASSSPSAPLSTVASTSPRGSWLRKEYDLRPIGFDLVIDLRWSRAR